MIQFSIEGARTLEALTEMLESPEGPMKIACMVAQEQTMTLIGECFKSGTDPYGKPWNAPNRLQITGGIRSYARGPYDATGFSVHSTDEKALWHHAPQPRANWGGQSLPTRMQVPTDARGLPPEWAKRITKVMEKSLALQLSRGMR